MKVDSFLKQLEWLTGTSVKDLTSLDRTFLTSALADDDNEIDCSQFNEMLLIANKDRVGKPFFDYFFNADNSDGDCCKIADLPKAVEKFQKIAMLRYGNFIYAYRTLTPSRTLEELLHSIGDYATPATTLLRHFSDRQPKVIEIDQIKRDRTYLIGYISAGQAVREHERAQKLIHLIESDNPTSFQDLSVLIPKNVSNEEAGALQSLLDRWSAKSADRSTVAKLLVQLRADLPELSALVAAASEVQKQGEGNTDIYLTWDYMDVYIATSMRQKWEYEQLYDFVSELMSSETLKALNLRYFDPTQSFEANRIDKGLVEALMLKRAGCTVYSVQDTDTLGKDSELAATLAQGKPVIAFAPEIDVAKRTEQLMVEEPSALRDRLLFVQNADESFGYRAGEPELIELMATPLNDVMEKTLWRSLPDSALNTEFRASCGADLEKFCHLIALSERNIYNKRAKMLKETHPLAIQVHLATGVANGVLVARDIDTCAELVRRILLNKMEFYVVEDADTNCWLLKEAMTDSIYRVVTKNRKLTNCFWNYYAEGYRR